MRSEIVIRELAGGSERVVYATDALIEAPNWSPDGRTLVFNGDGLIYRLDLGDTRPVVIDTGFARACNNDHGIAPDGSLLVVSDKTETGKSCIYTLPIAGGALRRVTGNVPSWWHGWSPDGARLAYVGGRDEGALDIYTIAVEGGAETRLTDGAGHHDGPDYTPDGRWIWFNSDRGGTMQLWRIRPDGTELARMTGDERVNWFPHPSPDGSKVLYLAFEPGTAGHPRDREVELRMMDAEGGPPTTVAAIFGGQGSINVPCWSPDGAAFAYMRYARPPN